MTNHLTEEQLRALERAFRDVANGNAKPSHSDAIWGIKLIKQLRQERAAHQATRVELDAARQYIHEVNHVIGGAETLDDVQGMYRLPHEIREYLDMLTTRAGEGKRMTNDTLD